jgi:hypothetical protein
MMKPPIWKRLLRWTAFALLAVVTVLALAISWISYQGRVDWARTKADLLAKGEKLTLVELAPPPVADKDNFFADPIWKAESEPKLNIHSFQKPPLSPIRRADTPLTSSEAAEFRRLFPDDHDLVGDNRAELCAAILARFQSYQLPPLGSDKVRSTFLLETLAPLRPVMDRIRELLKRPAARWPFVYGEYLFTQGSDPYPDIMSVAKAFAVEGHFLLSFGQTATAAEDARIIFDLGERLKNDPLLYAQMLRAGMLAIASGVLGQGLSAHAWSDEDLQKFESIIARIDLMSAGALAFRGERGLDNQFIESLSKKPAFQRVAGHLRAFPPSLPLRIQIAIFGMGDQATLNRMVQQIAEAFDSADTKGFHIPKETRKFRTGLDLVAHFRTNRFRYLLLGNVDVLARQETDFRQALIVCALERYRLKYKCYPETLDALVPDFIERLPKDVYTTKPFQYRLESPDQFRLWSVGPVRDDIDDDIVWNH